MSVKDLQGNVVSDSSFARWPMRFLAVALAVVLIAALLGYRVYDCTNFNSLNRQRLRHLEHYGAAATLRDSGGGWKNSWLVKNTSPMELIFFDHPRFEQKALAESDVTRIAQLINGLPNVASVHISRKSMSPEIVADLRERLDNVELTTN